MKDLEEFAQKLIEEGFRVFQRPGGRTFLFAAIGGEIGYVQESIGVGYRYSTVHKPNVGTGTGFFFSEGPLNPATMRRCCKCVVPAWWNSGHVSCEKWQIEKWVENNQHLREVVKNSPMTDDPIPVPIGEG